MTPRDSKVNSSQRPEWQASSGPAPGRGPGCNTDGSFVGAILPNRVISCQYTSCVLKLQGSLFIVDDTMLTQCPGNA